MAKPYDDYIITVLYVAAVIRRQQLQWMYSIIQIKCSVFSRGSTVICSVVIYFSAARLH